MSTATPMFPALQPPDARAREVMRKQDIPWEPTLTQLLILRHLVWHLGAAYAVPLKDLVQKCGANDRDIKDAIRSLVVDFKVRIGSSRNGSAPGYYLVTSPQEARDAAQPLIGEIRHLVQRVRVLLDPHDLAELAGQLGFSGLEEEERLP